MPIEYKLTIGVFSIRFIVNQSARLSFIIINSYLFNLRTDGFQKIDDFCIQISFLRYFIQKKTM